MTMMKTSHCFDETIRIIPFLESNGLIIRVPGGETTPTGRVPEVADRGMALQ